MWECEKCNQANEDSFDACWKCGTPKNAAAETQAGTRESQPAPPLVCSRCGSHEVIPNVRIVDRGDGNMRRDLQVELYENPDAFIFKGAHAGTLSASICGSCGYIEIRVSNPQELLTAYKKSKTA
jgi:hypothetical protein